MKREYFHVPLLCREMKGKALSNEVERRKKKNLRISKENSIIRNKKLKKNEDSIVIGKEERIPINNFEKCRIETENL